MPGSPIPNSKGRRVKILICLILLFGAFLRFYKIGEIPPGVNRDEASIGYTAYSLLTTGKDEYGRTFPISFESFGDWKLPLYIYASIPFIKLFGLSPGTIRLLSALSGTISIYLIYLLGKKIFESENAGLLSMALFAINPWGLFLSRVASETNVAVFLVLVGLVCLLYFEKKRQLFLVLSSLCFSLTFFTYHGNHIATSLLLLGILPLFWPRKNVGIKINLLSIILFVFFVGTILSQTLFSANKTKISGISFLSNPSLIHLQIELPRKNYEGPSKVLGIVLHNKVTFAVETIYKNYLKAFSPDFLVISGGKNHAHNMAGYGNILYPDWPLFIVGIGVLLFSWKKKNYKLILWWLIISPAAAAITIDGPHTTRMALMAPAIIFSVTAGLLWILSEIRNPNFRKGVLLIFGIGYIVSFVFYLDTYFVHFPKNESENWGYSYAVLAKLTENPEYSKKIVTISHPEYSPYIFLLFYLQYPASIYQKEAEKYSYTSDSFAHVAAFNRFKFKDIQWDSDLPDANHIVVAVSSEIPLNIQHSTRYKKTPILLPNDNSFLTVVEKI